MSIELQLIIVLFVICAGLAYWLLKLWFYTKGTVSGVDEAIMELLRLHPKQDRKIFSDRMLGKAEGRIPYDIKEDL